MVELFVAKVIEVPKEPWEFLSEWRKEKIFGKMQEKSRMQSICAGLLLWEVLFRYGLDSRLETCGEFGKPEIEGLSFNLSHSGDLVICAVSQEMVGCDVEQIRTLPDRLFQRFFSEEEKRYLERLPDRRRQEEGIRLWTMKESYIKMTGEGMHLPFSKFSVLSNGRPELIREGKKVDCRIWTGDFGDYKLAVCGMEKEWKEGYTIVSLEKLTR